MKIIHKSCGTTVPFDNVFSLYKCPRCQRYIEAEEILRPIAFADCVTLIRVAGINKDPVSILAMFRDAIGKL